MNFDDYTYNTNSTITTTNTTSKDVNNCQIDDKYENYDNHSKKNNSDDDGNGNNEKQH